MTRRLRERAAGMAERLYYTFPAGGADPLYIARIAQLLRNLKREDRTAVEDWMDDLACAQRIQEESDYMEPWLIAGEIVDDLTELIRRSTH